MKTYSDRLKTSCAASSLHGIFFSRSRYDVHLARGSFCNIISVLWVPSQHDTEVISPLERPFPNCSPKTQRSVRISFVIQRLCLCPKGVQSRGWESPQVSCRRNPLFLGSTDSSRGELSRLEWWSYATRQLTGIAFSLPVGLGRLLPWSNRIVCPS